jgi:predicted alpha/beta superfamily hydrolase
MLPVLASPPPVVAPVPPLQQEPVHDDGVSGDVVLIHDFPSQALHNQRNLMIYLPPGYDPNSSQRYPVVYLQDGQNLFDPQTSAFGHEWHLDEWAEKLLAEHRMAPVIMVGVYNTPDRMSEYTPVPDPKHGGGNAGAYEDFLIHELKPWVDQHYRTQSDAAHTAVMGSSLGGLVALDAGFKHPEVFGRIGVLSPSLWWDDENFTKTLQTTPPGPQPQRIWLDMGTNEGEEPQENIQDTERLRDALEHRGYREGQTLIYREVDGGQHNEDSWADIAGDVLTSLFPPAP